MDPFSAVVRERTLPPGSPTGYRYEVVILLHDEPVLLSRQRLELRDDWQMRTDNFNAWKTVEPPCVWIERCRTLEDANHLAHQRREVLNKLADLFDADTAVSLYRDWDTHPA